MVPNSTLTAHSYLSRAPSRWTRISRSGCFPGRCRRIASPTRGSHSRTNIHPLKYAPSYHYGTGRHAPVRKYSGSWDAFWSAARRTLFTLLTAVVTRDVAAQPGARPFSTRPGRPAWPNQSRAAATAVLCLFGSGAAWFTRPTPGPPTSTSARRPARANERLQVGPDLTE